MATNKVDKSVKPTARVDHVSPRELAAAIGMSESSLRRWVDQGDIHLTRTVGGHRRIPISEAIQLIRTLRADIVRPEILGIDPKHLHAGRSSAGLTEQLQSALLAGQAALASALLTGAYLGGQSMAELADGPILVAMQHIGALWEHDPRGILIEHRATAICVNIISTLKTMIPQRSDKAPLAVGCAPSGDPYMLGSMLASAVLAEVGFRDSDFGANTPLDMLAREAIDRKAKIVWLSISASNPVATLRSGVERLAKELAQAKIELVIGGRQQARLGLSLHDNVHPAGSMGELAAFARGMQRTSAKAR